MNRVSELLKHVTKQHRGIEIGPYHSPLVPRREGYNSVALDVFGKAELKRRAAADSNIPAANVNRIEDVDLEGSAGDIAELVGERFGYGQFDYVVSSHNFEHLPNPIRFLQGCEKVLKPGGWLSLAIPDRRFCFDFYRPVTDLAEWIDAYAQGRRRPTPGQVFRGEALRSDRNGVGAWAPGVPGVPEPHEKLEVAYAVWKDLTGAGENAAYHDAHCSAFTPASFELLVTDLRHLGLTNFSVDEVTEPNGCEFYAHLRNDGDRQRAEPHLGADREDFYARRRVLMQRAAAEVIDTSAYPSSFAELGRLARTMLRSKARGRVRRIRNSVATAALVARLRSS